MKTRPSSAVQAGGALRLLLDVSPLTRATRNRTGLARVAWALAAELARDPRVDLRVCSWGSLLATSELKQVAREEPWLRLAATRDSRLASFYWWLVSACGRPGSSAGVGWLRLAQLINLLRTRVPGASGEQFDAIHSTYAGVPRGVRHWQRPTVVTVHDLTPLRLPAAQVSREQVAITRRLLGTIRATDWVACVSEHTRRDYLAYCAHPSERTVVIPNGVDHARFHPVREPAAMERVRKIYRLGDAPYVVTLSSLAEHKNLRLLLETWPEIRRRFPMHRLVLAGGKGSDAVSLLRGLGFNAPLPDGVQLTGFVPDDDLPALYSAAELFAFPSLYEGFGLPVLEAMACGAPVVVSRSSSLPEVVGDCGLLVDPIDRRGWVDAMAACLARGRRAGPDVAAVGAAARFPWARTAGAYVELYERACRSS